MNPPVPATQLKDRLEIARQRQAAKSAGQLMQISGIGQVITATYEHLRNAAEYTDEHLLLERAIRRFYKRSISFRSKHIARDMGEDLISELTQAGYLKNGTISVDTAEAISQLVESSMEAYGKLRKERVGADEATKWTLDILSVESEKLLNPHEELSVFTYFAYEHYLKLLPKQNFQARRVEMERFEAAMYIAVHLALLKSDMATVRADLVKLYRQTPDDIVAFIKFNREITGLYKSSLVQSLKQAVNKYGAPMRVLKILVEERPELPALLANRQAFLSAYEQQTIDEYRSIAGRLNRGLVKSIVFLIITKVLIGLLIEVPYDLLTTGSVDYLPLTINLLFPPLYMASLKLGLHPPTQSNAIALSDYIDATLFTNKLPLKPNLRSTGSASVLLKLLSPILFLIPFGIIVFVLGKLHFNVLQGIIFFVFLSGASFLGFRLANIVRELELVAEQGGLFATIRDIFYLPFVMVGKWMSAKYARFNFVGLALDMLIELPLKSVLRIFRQWSRFVSEKRDEIY